MVSHLSELAGVFLDCQNLKIPFAMIGGQFQWDGQQNQRNCLMAKMFNNTLPAGHLPHEFGTTL